MAIYKPSLLDKFKDFVNGLRSNWDQYEAHVADFEAHVADFEAHVADFEAHQAEDAQKHISESGENANGRYVRFDDGTQICTYIATVTDQAITDTYGSLYQGGRTWYFPALFASDPVVISGTFKWGSSASWGTCNRSSVSSADLRVYDITSRASGENTILKFAAIGRWK